MYLLFRSVGCVCAAVRPDMPLVSIATYTSESECIGTVLRFAEAAMHIYVGLVPRFHCHSFRTLPVLVLGGRLLFLQKVWQQT